MLSCYKTVLILIMCVVVVYMCVSIFPLRHLLFNASEIPCRRKACNEFVLFYCKRNISNYAVATSLFSNKKYVCVYVSLHILCICKNILLTYISTYYICLPRTEKFSVLLWTFCFQLQCLHLFFQFLLLADIALIIWIFVNYMIFVANFLNSLRTHFQMQSQF